MCGIYGSITPSEFYNLHEANKVRGTSGYGCLHIGVNSFNIQKFRTVTSPIDCPVSSIYNLGHNRAPTTNESGRNFSNSHPFSYGNAIAAHNGILINTTDLKCKWKTEFPVDSQWIPFLYNNYYKEINDPLKTFTKTLENISGTYGIWLYDIDNHTIFVARGDNTIFWDKQYSSFSSIKTELCDRLMPEGAIYQSTNMLTFKDKNENNRLKRQKKYFIL
jgi:glucosamine 6-phosphate synthetase-like amidotransferase/phosphosugar isomerase protein